MVTAFVFSGGGSLGAVQVGTVQALSERGIHPDILIGTSAGSLNAAFIAGRGDSPDSLRQLADVWAGLKRSDVFPLRPIRATLALLGRRSSFCSPEPLARLLRDEVSFPLLEHALTPLYVVTADMLTGQEVLLSEGDTVSALLASCAIPGLLPVVHREGRQLCDGALAYSSGISQAVALGADVTYLLPGGTSCALATPPRHPLAATLHAVTLLLQQRALLETVIYQQDTDLRVIPPLCPLPVSSADFSQARLLIDRAYRSAGTWLDAGSDQLPEPERFLSLHGHTRGDRLPSRAG
jgi:NTE family protein